MRTWFRTAAKVPYVAAAGVLGAGLANVLIFSQTAFYPHYGRGVSAQNAAGALMMVEQTVLTLALLVWLFVRLGREEEARQDLLDIARERGVALSDERAARAASAGAA